MLKIFVSATQHNIYILWVNARLAWCINRFLNVKVLVGTFHQEKTLIGAFFVIVKSSWTFVSSSNQGRDSAHESRQLFKSEQSCHIELWMEEGDFSVKL